MADTDAPDIDDDDIRHDDLEFNPRLEPTKAKAWLNMLEESEKAFEPWNDHCDKIDKQYANIERLAGIGREKEFQMFWANCEVIKPSIYAKPPEPVVVPKFNDRRPVYTAASEILERCCKVSFDLACINDLMLLIRDDVAIAGRGVAWCRYESGQGKGFYDHEKVCFDFKHRRDFLHSVSRCWEEVTWVAAASYLTRDEARKRFHEHSGDEYKDADYRVDRDAKEVGGADDRERAKFWELWHKPTKRVVWVAEGCENILDEDEAHLDLQNFWPCPKPAYGTVQRGSLVPVPDVLQYKDQLDEINKLTARIHALSDCLEAKGFYPAGGAELGDAIQAAITTHTPGRVLVPISNWAAFGGTKDVIIWMPIAEVASTIQQCTTLRQAIIQDIYQVMGLSDIMRGSTDPRETLGAQNLKSQFGSTRIRDKQNEMVRLARDLVSITADIITDKFDKVTIIEMSQTQLPTNTMKQRQLADLTRQMAQQQQAMQMAMQQPQFAQAQQQNPQQVQQITAQAQQVQQEGQAALAKVQDKPTVDQVFALFKNDRRRSFVLDIETDSTIMIDENTEKQRRGEFIGVLAQLLPQLAQMVSLEPKSAPFCGEILKFSTAPFRAGRTLEGTIDVFVDQMEQKASQPRGDDPATIQAKTAKEIEQMKTQRAADRDKQDAVMEAAKLKQNDDHVKLKLANDRDIEMAKLRSQQEEDAAKAQQTNIKAMADREKHQADMLKRNVDMRATQQKANLAVQSSALKQQDMLARADERRAAQQFRQMNQPPQGMPR